MKRNCQSKIESDDRASVIYHVVYSHEGFDESSQILFKLVQRTQKVRPGTTRKLFLDIEGHRNSEGGFDADMLELQKDFLLGFLAQFLAEIHCPLFQATNPKPQENDIPEELIIKLS
ncbi:MAG: hypothetical protein ACREOO_13115 [bacterium]